MNKKQNTVIETPNKVLLISYTTLVAYLDKQVREVVRTSTRHSKTTSVHINQFIREYKHNALVSEISQEDLENTIKISVTNL